MYLSKKNLLNLPVFTKSNQFLGKIFDFEIDSETQSIIKYHVKSKRLIKYLLLEKRNLIIHRNQVICLDNEKMLVEDNIIKERVKRFRGIPVKKESPSIVSIYEKH